VHDVSKVPETKTKVCMNIGSPESAFMYSFIPNKGVGLAREEFIIASGIRVHPNALLNFDKLDSKLKNKIEKITRVMVITMVAAVDSHKFLVKLTRPALITRSKEIESNMRNYNL
jgi:phosphoenolpyruvate synthase/pyruvate phosphate dikinase